MAFFVLILPRHSPRTRCAFIFTVHGRAAESLTDQEFRDVEPILAELGTSKKTSARAQQLAGLKDEVYAAIRAGVVTLNEALRGQRREDLKAKVAAFPANKHRVIYADPPWAYGDERTGLQGYTAAETHYSSRTRHNQENRQIT